MPQGQDYLFAIQDKDFRFWKKLPDGSITVDAQPYFLIFSPIGWQDIAVQNVRNRRYWAIDRTVTGQLSSVNDGADILKYILLTKGHEEPVFITILEQQLSYNPKPGGVIEYTSGQSPFTPNTTTTGTITGTPGETVYVELYLNNPDLPDDELVGNFDAFNFVFNGYNPIPNNIPIIYPVVVPTGGVINFSITFNQSTFAGSNAGMQLVNSTNTVPGWAYWYKRRMFAEFDLTTYSHEGAAVKCTALEDSLAKWLKANEGTNIEFPDTDPNAVYVKLDGIKLHEKANYIDTPGVIFSPVTLGGGADRGLTTTIFLNKEGDSVGISFESQFQSAYPSFGDTIAQTNCVVHNFYTAPIVATITGRSEFIGTSQNGLWQLRRRFLLTSSTIPTQDVYAYHTSGVIAVGVTDGIDYTINITIPPGERLYTQSLFFGGVSGNPGVEFTDNSKFKIEFKSRYEPTYIKAFRPQYLFDKFIDFVTEGNYTAEQSAFLEANKNIVFTCGNFIRQLANSVLKWNFSDYFQFWDCFSSVGLSEIDGKVDIAEKQNLIDTTEITTLQNVSEISVSILTDSLFNVLKIGYPPIKNDVGVLNGNEEFNTGYEFSVGMVKHPGEMDKVSRIEASGYSIERLRIATVNKETTDNKSDNNIYPLAISGTLVPASGDIPAHYELDRSLNASATGLLEPETVFNIPLSPKLNFKRNGPWIHSHFYKTDTRTFNYQTVDKNNKLEFTHPTFGAIIEKAAENIGTLGDQFFVPIVFNITVPPPADLLSLLDANPLRIYQFELLGEMYKGILLEITTGMANNKAQQWELLALPDNNFLKLAKYYG